jgi:threonine/homoserine/homoserine lactone efflux protein
VLPQFAPQGEGMLSALVLLGLVFSLLTLLWLVAYAYAIAKAGDVLRRSAIRRALEGLTGAVLIALGLRLATEQR